MRDNTLNKSRPRNVDASMADEGTYVDQYLHSAAAKIKNETLVSLGEYVPAE